MTKTDLFGLIAPVYRRFAGFNQQEQLAKLAGLPREGRLLDLAGGTGRVSAEIADLASQVIVVDESHGMLKEAMKHTKIRVVLGMAEHLPFDSDCFECILLFDAFHHLKNQSVAVTEIWRILSPGGSAVIYEPDIRNLSVKLIALFEKLVFLRSHFRPIMNIGELLNQVGAQVKIFPDGNSSWIVATKNR